MKLRQRIFLVACTMLLGASLTGVQKTYGQIWAHYDCEIANVFFNPITGPLVNEIPVTSFLDFAGNFDPDDGVAVNIPTGFTYDYNGQTCGTVDVCVNGFIMLNKTTVSQLVPTITNDNNYLFTQHPPNDALAPYWGDHFYRTLEAGYTRSHIYYTTVATPDPNLRAPAGSVLRVFTVEWNNLNINDKTNPNSIATFQVKLIQNPMANDPVVPDNRVTIEFDYGNISSGTTLTTGATVGIKDSLGTSFENGLYPSNLFNGDSTRYNTTKRTSAWPPSGLPGRVIQFVPKGTLLENQWGDGDVTLDQLYNPDPNVRAHQNLFVTLADADTILLARTKPANGNGIYFGVLDSVEGGPAFHGDANHNGKYTNPNQPAFSFYVATSFDASYILLYLAAKLSVLPWPIPNPLPSYKEAENNGTNINGIALDARNATLSGSTLTVPVVLRGTANGALSLEAVVSTNDASALQYSGTHATPGSFSIMHSDATNGATVIAATGSFHDGDVIGYLEFNVGAKHDVNVSIDHVSLNDVDYSGTTVTIPLSTLGVASTGANGFAVQQNVPNPFNPTEVSSTTIGFTMGTSENVTARVYDLLGHEVRTLMNGNVLTAGQHAIQWDGRDNTGSLVVNGLYYYQITSPTFTQTVKMQVIR
jgi:hypothetical protein